jgi:hypothetical protein
MAKQTFTTGQVLTAAQQNSLQSNDFNQTVSVKTANYSLLAADKGTRIEFNTSGSVTCTVNSGQFDAGDTLIIQNRGAGTATITAGTATVNTSASLALAQYSAGTLYFVSASAALFFGDAAGISASIVDAKGDLIVGTADNTVGRLAVGTNGHTLVADSAEATGLKWAAASGGGKVLQVIQDTDSTFRSNATTTYQTTGLSQAITPVSASNKVLIMAAVTYRVTDEATTNNISFRIRRGSTTIIEDTYVAQKANSVYLGTRYTQIYLDSPSTTSSTTYELQFMNPNGTANALVQAGGADNQAVMILMEIGA